MEQRPLRLGDIVDDYCPRERRITNHAIVAVVGDAIRQTRCTTCDADHVYKHGKAPLRRKKEGADEPVTPAPPGMPPPAHVRPAAADAPADPPRELRTENAAPAAGEEPRGDAAPDEEAERVEEAWSTHRQLIRASLPRIEGEIPPPRPIPEFTMHQRPQSRGGRGFGYGHGWSGGNANGNTSGNGNGAHHNGFRPARQARGGPPQGAPGGDGRPGFGSGRPGRHQGKHKRSR